MLVITGGVTLFVDTGSPVGEPTLAIFVSEPLGGTLTVSVRLVIWLLVNAPTLHVTTPTCPLVVPRAFALAKVAPDGTVSVTVTPLAPDGPRLVTEIV